MSLYEHRDTRGTTPKATQKASNLEPSKTRMDDTASTRKYTLEKKLNRKPMRKNPLLEQAIYTIRDPRTGRAEFRKSLERIGEYLGLEIAQTLPTQDIPITTCLGTTATHNLLYEQPILVTLLRAGIPLYTGLQNIFTEAESGFLGTMRDEETLQSKTTYIALPNLTNKTIILADTMIATGGSIIDALDILKPRTPKRIILAGCIASEKAITRLEEHFQPQDIHIAAIDPHLNEKGYIVPGLGDAGDRSYGRKV